MSDELPTPETNEAWDESCPLYRLSDAEKKEFAAGLERQRDELLEAVIKAEQFISSNEWLPIEHAPMDGTVVDIWSKSYGRLTNYYHQGSFFIPSKSGPTIVADATHYRPLPEPPNE